LPLLLKHTGFALDIAAFGLLAKLGHIPWALSAKKWMKPSHASWLQLGIWLRSWLAPFVQFR
jgi:hypothetical protein